MKYFVKLFVIILFLFNSNLVYADQTVAFIDIDRIMNTSKVGKQLKNDLENSHKTQIEKFKKIEVDLKKEEDDILSKKNVLKKEEVENKIRLLRDKIKNYRDERTKTIDDLTKERIEMSNKFLNLIQPIIAEYIQENSISIVFQKKDIVIGKTELDITNSIIAIVDEKINSVN